MKFKIPKHPQSVLPNDLSSHDGHNSQDDNYDNPEDNNYKSDVPKRHHDGSKHSPRSHRHPDNTNGDENGLPKNADFNPLDTSLTNNKKQAQDANRNLRPGMKSGSHKHDPTHTKSDLNKFQNQNRDMKPHGLLQHGMHFLMPHLSDEMMKNRYKHGGGNGFKKFDPLRKPMNRMQNNIDNHSKLMKDSGLSMLAPHAMNGVRRLMFLGMTLVHDFLGGLYKAALAMFGGNKNKKSKPSTKMGLGFAHISKAFGMSPRGFGVLLCTLASVFCLMGVNQLFNARDMESVGCAIQKVADDSSPADSVSGATGAWTQKGTKAYNTAKRAYAECKKLGLNDKQASGIVGQSAQEDSTFSLVQPSGDGLGGVGLYQVTPGSKLYNYCDQHHLNWKTPEAQVDYMVNVQMQAVSSNWKDSSKNESVSQCAMDAAKAEGGGGLMVDSNEGNRDSGAQKAYSMFNGVGGEAASMNDAAAGNSSGCSGGSDGDSTGDGDDIISYGEKYVGLPYTEDPRRNQGGIDIANGKPKSQCDPTDCAGFVWGVLKHLHYKVTPGNPWITTNEQSFSGCKHVSAGQTHAGIALVENDNGDPHTGFLKEKWRGDATKFLDEDGGSALGHCVGNNTYGTAFAGCKGTPVFLQEEKD